MRGLDEWIRPEARQHARTTELPGHERRLTAAELNHTLPAAGLSRPANCVSHRILRIRFAWISNASVRISFSTNSAREGWGPSTWGSTSETGRLVAVKVLTASLAREAGFVERFNREIDAMRKLKNPHIVELFESGVDGRKLLLRDGVRRRRDADVAAAPRKAAPLGKGGGDCRPDLPGAQGGPRRRASFIATSSPRTCWSLPKGSIKLTDFGVAQVFASSRLTVTGGIIGTAEYMSPEQAQGKRAGKQSDLYSLGAVLLRHGHRADPVFRHDGGGGHSEAQIRPVRPPADVCSRSAADASTTRSAGSSKRIPRSVFRMRFVLLRHLEQLVRLEEFATTGATVTGNPEEQDSSATTVATTSRCTGSAPQHPGPATLMQSLVRAELANPKEGVLAAFFNNTYVLIGLLALVIGGGIWWFRPHSRRAEELFDGATALLQHEPGTDWLRAKNEYFRRCSKKIPTHGATA